jgi:bifunctional DNA-binding transcriptional regulator/antitoxin component of YhaV-PrlF toxin-antitoxin module
MGRKPEEEIKLRKIYRDGKIYIPAKIRRQFRGCYFSIYVSDGKIVLDPVKEW